MATAPSPPPPSSASADDISGQLLGAAITFAIVDTGVAILRGLAIYMKRRPFELHDWFFYIGFLFILGQCALGIVFVYYTGAGHHTKYVEQTAPYEVNRAWVIKYCVQVLYISAFTFPKLSILFLYRKIFFTKTTRTAIWVLVAIVVGTWIGETFSGIFQCIPVAAAYDRSITPTHCVNQTAMYEYWSVPNLVTDLAMLILPMPVIWHLKISRLQKIGLTATFCLGSVGIVACIIRFIAFFQQSSFTDPEWAAVNHEAWTIAEPSFYFIASALPLLRPVGLSVWNKASQVMKYPRGTGFTNTTEDLTGRRAESDAKAEITAAGPEEKQNVQRGDRITRTDEVTVGRETV